jgi:hypothetical protein
MTENNGKWIAAFEDYLDRFGLVKFAEVNSLNVGDFERSLKHYIAIIKTRALGNIRFGDVKFGEIDNEYINDFRKSFMHYFT